MEKNGNLEAALAVLIQNQAAFVGQMNELAKHQVLLSRQQEDGQQRFSRIESELEQIRKILLGHDKTLKGLLEAIRQKIGFKAK